jgi:uncharacterized membrane protein
MRRRVFRAMPSDTTSTTPEHIDETIAAIARLHAEHEGAATGHQRFLNRAAALISRPWVITALTIVVAGWIGLNLALEATSRPVIDPPPFQWLQGAVSLLALYLVVLIVGAQQHDDRLMHNRDMLNLELAILSEQKTAKVIQLLEEFRRDTPNVHDRVDTQADAMAQPSDPRTVLEALKGAGAASTRNV